MVFYTTHMDIENVHIWNALEKMSNLIEINCQLGNEFKQNDINVDNMFNRLAQIPKAIHLTVVDISKICQVFFDDDPTWFNVGIDCVHLSCKQGAPYAVPQATLCDVNPCEYDRNYGSTTNARTWFKIDGKWSQTIYQEFQNTNEFIIALCNNFIEDTGKRRELISKFTSSAATKATKEAEAHMKQLKDSEQTTRNLKTAFLNRVFDNPEFRQWKSLVNRDVYTTYDKYIVIAENVKIKLPE